MIGKMEKWNPCLYMKRLAAPRIPAAGAGWNRTGLAQDWNSVPLRRCAGGAVPAAPTLPDRCQIVASPPARPLAHSLRRAPYSRPVRMKLSTALKTASLPQKLPSAMRERYSSSLNSKALSRPGSSLSMSACMP